MSRRTEYSPAMESALKQLRKLVAEGMEFPDATAKVHRKTGFMVDELRRAYDLRDKEVANERRWDRLGGLNIPDDGYGW
jgi:hypothetical protein